MRMGSGEVQSRPGRFCLEAPVPSKGAAPRLRCGEFTGLGWVGARDTRRLDEALDELGHLEVKAVDPSLELGRRVLKPLAQVLAAAGSTIIELLGQRLMVEWGEVLGGGGRGSGLWICPR